jgi:CubicO group peptidase (beta-lactamase class C family)
MVLGTGIVYSRRMPTKQLVAVLGLALLLTSAVGAQQKEAYDYWRPQRDMIERGQQALMMCNGLFTSNRTIDLVFAQELAYLRQPVGTPQGGDYQVDRARRAVAVGSPHTGPVMRSAFREGLGCVIMAPDQTFDDIDGLPALRLPPPEGDAATLAWPDGDASATSPLPAEVNRAALQAASDWAFNRESREQVTLSLVLVHRGRIIHERYAPGVDMTTRTRTWSTAKSLAATLFGILADEGRMALDTPLGFEWLPRAQAPDKDPRAAVTLRHLLHMSSGLDTVDNGGLEYATGSGMAYWAGASSVRGALGRGLIREPGASWDYENYDTLLAVYAMKRALGSDQAYLEFPRRALLDRLGMRNTLIGVDRFGDFILSSQVYTNARDLARLGLLYQQKGSWHGKRVLSESWIDFVRTPAPATSGRGNQYGGHWWLVPDNRTDVPKNAYSTAGNRGQFVIVVPSHELVIVRRGLDFGRQGFDRWDLTREVLKAFPPASTQ